jgi:hypothetical protein
LEHCSYRGDTLALKGGRREFAPTNFSALQFNVLNALLGVCWALALPGIAYGMLGATPSHSAIFLAFLFVAFAATAWVRRDAKSKQIALPFDWPWLLWAGWPIAWLWYSRYTRRSWIITLAIVGAPAAFPLGEALGGLVRLALNS